VQTKKIYQVGGCVRDRLIGIKFDDIDLVAVGYEPADFDHLQQVGKDFPVYITQTGQELALARLDKKTAKGYNGFDIIIKNVTIEDDLKRRDLTINSIAFDDKTKQYIDPFNGKDDIKNQILRHTSFSFTEDPLRVLRLARFQAKFSSFTIANETKKLVYDMRYQLSELEPNRIYKELKKVLALPCSYLFYNTLYDLKVLRYIFPNVDSQETTIFKQSMQNLKLLKYEDMLLKLTAIYYNCDLDIVLPKKLYNKILVLKQPISCIFSNNDMLLSFIKSFKKDFILFESYLKLHNILNNKLDKIYLDLKILFKDICNYSPKKWIIIQEEKPTVEQIISNIDQYNAECIFNFNKKITNYF